MPRKLSSILSALRLPNFSAPSEQASPLPDQARRAFLAGSALGIIGMLAGCKPRDYTQNAPTKTVLPPGAGSTERFLEKCTGCQLCIAACPNKVLQASFLEFGVQGFMKPRMDFSAKYCLFDCHECAKVCPTGAIRKMPIEEKQQVKIAEAELFLCRCLVPRNGVDCGACTEHCPTKALYTIEKTLPNGNVVRLPQLNPALCIGCGACEHACPVTYEAPADRKRKRNCKRCHRRCSDLSCTCLSCTTECVRNEIPSRALVVSAINPQTLAVKFVEPPAIDPNEGKDFAF